MEIDQSQAFLCHCFRSAGVAIGPRHVHGAQQAFAQLQCFRMSLIVLGRIGCRAKQSLQMRGVRHARCQLSLATLAEQPNGRARQRLPDVPDAYLLGQKRVPRPAKSLPRNYRRAVPHWPGNVLAHGPAACLDRVVANARHAGDSLRFCIDAATETYRAFTTRIPLARTASEWWRGGARLSMVCRTLGSRCIACPHFRIGQPSLD